MNYSDFLSGAASSPVTAGPEMFANRFRITNPVLYPGVIGAPRGILTDITNMNIEFVNQPEQREAYWKQVQALMGEIVNTYYWPPHAKISALRVLTNIAEDECQFIRRASGTDVYGDNTPQYIPGTHAPLTSFEHSLLYLQHSAQNRDDIKKYLELTRQPLHANPLMLGPPSDWRGGGDPIPGFLTRVDIGKGIFYGSSYTGAGYRPLDFGSPAPPPESSGDRMLPKPRLTGAQRDRVMDLGPLMQKPPYWDTPSTQPATAVGLISDKRSRYPPGAAQQSANLGAGRNPTGGASAATAEDDWDTPLVTDKPRRRNRGRKRAGLDPRPRPNRNRNRNRHRSPEPSPDPKDRTPTKSPYSKMARGRGRGLTVELDGQTVPVGRYGPNTSRAVDMQRDVRIIDGKIPDPQKGQFDDAEPSPVWSRPAGASDEEWFDPKTWREDSARPHPNSLEIPEDMPPLEGDSGDEYMPSPDSQEGSAPEDEDPDESLPEGYDDEGPTQQEEDELLRDPDSAGKPGAADEIAEEFEEKCNVGTNMATPTKKPPTTPANTPRTPDRVNRSPSFLSPDVWGPLKLKDKKHKLAAKILEEENSIPDWSDEEE